MGEIRVHKSREVLEYMTGNADRPVTAEELVRETGWRADSVYTAMSRFVERYPGRMERIGKGSYRWNSIAKEIPAPEQEPPTEMIVKILTERPDRMLVQDLDTGLLYVMTQFEF